MLRSYRNVGWRNMWDGEGVGSRRSGTTNLSELLMSQSSSPAVSTRGGHVPCSARLPRVREPHSLLPCSQLAFTHLQAVKASVVAHVERRV